MIAQKWLEEILSIFRMFVASPPSSPSSHSFMQACELELCSDDNFLIRELPVIFLGETVFTWPPHVILLRHDYVRVIGHTLYHPYVCQRIVF